MPPAAAQKKFFGTRLCIPRMRGPEPRQRTSSSALLLILEQARVLAREFKPAKDFVLCTPAD